jgi:hypothetical protein
MTTLTSTDSRVVSFFNHYKETSKKRPSLYTAANAVVVTLPADLLDYANAAAGHSGFGSGARPVGIRKTVDNSGRVISQIFESVESLTKFINSSECNAHEYIETVRARHLGKSVKPTTDNRPANEVFFEKYTTNDAKALQAKFGRDMVISDFNTLTINEFELRYGLGL